MGVLVFSHYYETGHEGEPFAPGQTPTLDGIDGFFDQSFETAEPGDGLSFLVSGVALRATLQAPRPDAAGLRARLAAAPLVTGTIVETDRSTFARWRVDRREPFGEVVRRKPLPDENESLGEVSRYAGIWGAIRDAFERLGDRYRYALGCQLPRLADVRRSLERGVVVARPDARSTLLLEALPPGGGAVRVVALGANDINSSRVYDLTHLDQYEAAVRLLAEGALLDPERQFWESLLG